MISKRCMDLRPGSVCPQNVNEFEATEIVNDIISDYTKIGNDLRYCCC